jgi:hypothetical protein
MRTWRLRWWRKPRTQQERKAIEACPSDVKARRRTRLPTEWDDQQVPSSRSWKDRRKTQCRTVQIQG